MKALPFVISKKAVNDLEEIWLYTADKWSIEQADRYYNLIFDEINYICRNMNAGKSMEHVRKGYRAAKVKSHLIFYRVINNTIEVIRILHERMDIEIRL
jgi:toxin ParE1/3/4